MKKKRSAKILKTKKSKTKRRKKATAALNKRKEKKETVFSPPELGSPLSHLLTENNSQSIKASPPDYRPREEKYCLPLKYGDNCIVLLPRDPWWVHSYWDISQKRIDEVINSIPDKERHNLQWILRLYDVTAIDETESQRWHSFFDVDINFEASNWYININQTERVWFIEIGLRNSAGKFFPVARSNVVKMPYFGISSQIDEEWTLPDDDYFKMLGVYELGKSSLEMKERFEEVMRHQISSPLASWGSNFLVKEESFK